MTLAARAWVEVCEPLDRQLAPLGKEAIAALQPARGERILDVGCGAGQTLLQLAEMVGSEGAVVGVDIAAELLEVARERVKHLPNVDLLCGDAQRLDLRSLRLDAIFSRFGVMAFADPVAAFENLQAALRPGAGSLLSAGARWPRTTSILFRCGPPAWNTWPTRPHSRSKTRDGSATFSGVLASLALKYARSTTRCRAATWRACCSC
jgi:SAM-dependent methyltransferase